MNPVFLSRVEGTFALAGRGVVVDPGIPHSPETHRVFIGDDLEIRREDGSVLATKVSGLEMSGSLKRGFTPIVLPVEVTEDEVPIGAEVWQLSRRANTA
jgi:hypothetical protein